MIKLEEIKTDCDLSYAGYDHVIGKIQDRLNPFGDNEHPYDPKKKLIWELRVNSLYFAEALSMAYATGAGCKIDFTYREDEWSLTGFYYDEDWEQVGLTIHSHGA